MVVISLDLPEGYLLRSSVRRGKVSLYVKNALGLNRRVFEIRNVHDQPSHEWAKRKAVKHAWLRENPLIDFEDDNEW